MSLYDAAVAELTAWVPPTEEQSTLRTAYLAHLLAHPNGVLRDCNPEHLTASLLVVSQCREKVLLNLHGRYGIWVQFGGHCELADADLASAALREGAEESGISNLVLLGDRPAQLSRHEVRCGPVWPSYHLDVRYVAVAPDDAMPVTSSESLDVRWFDCTDLPASLEQPLRELVQEATSR